MSDSDGSVVDAGPEQNLADWLDAELRRDQVTGVGNRRAVEDRLATEWERSRRYGRPLSVVAIEVNRSRQAKDADGPTAGDLVLRSVANTLVETSRMSDFVGRIVGDEFVLICPEADEEGARGVTMKVVDVMTGGLDHGPDGPAWPLGISAGWATRRGEQTAGELLQEADRALYSNVGDGVTTQGRSQGPVERTRPQRNEQAEREAHYKWMERAARAT